MTDLEVTAEIEKRNSGIRTNLCLFGCGRRTSSQEMFHNDCWNFEATPGQRAQINRLTMISDTRTAWN